MVLPLAAGVCAPAGAQPVVAPAPPAGPVAEATVQKVIWLTDRRVAVWVNSPSMVACAL